jgi:hypothetical protein
MPSVKAAFRKAMVCAVLAGCSGGAGSGGPDGGPRTGSIALDDYADAVVNAVCERAVDCSLFPDVATCLASTGVVPIKPVEAADLVKSGLAQYDPVAAAACLDALPRRCWTQYDWLFEQAQFFGMAICRKVFQGTLPGSAPCCSGAECVSELCGGPGFCEPERLVPVGGRCDSNARLYCEFGLLCSPEGICEAPLPAGANCADQPWQQCELPSYCSSAAAGSSTPGICMTIPDEGEPCDGVALRPCLRFDDYCDLDTDVCTRRLPPGAACHDILFSYQCVSYAACIDGVCKSQPGLGEACRPEMPCMAGLPCVNNVCSPAPPRASICQP